MQAVLPCPLSLVFLLNLGSPFARLYPLFYLTQTNHHKNCLVCRPHYLEQQQQQQQYTGCLVQYAYMVR